MSPSDRAICSATKRNGTACPAPALPSSAQHRCFAHDETAAAARRRGGQGHGTVARALKALPPDLQDARTTLVGLIAQVRSGEVLPAVAVAVGTLVGRLLDLHRWAHEIGQAAELERRLGELEEAVTQRRWD